MRKDTVALVQGTYFAATGVWPLVHMRSFEAITGRKRDHWLVNTVGLLVGVVGTALVVSARRGGPSADLRGVALGTALALAAVDVYYVARGRIRPIYLADAVAELALVAAWASTTSSGSHGDAV